MGDFSGGGKDTTNAATTTTNQQVGVQGGGTGLSGTVYGVQAAGAGLQNTTLAGTGNQINIMTSDHDALEANQAIAQQSINANAQVAINALEYGQQASNNSASLAHDVVSATSAIAAQAAPVSTGNLQLAGQSYTLANNKNIIIAAAIVGGLALLYVLSKK